VAREQGGGVTLNLTALAEARAKMTPGEWSTLIGSACSPAPDEACGISSSQWRDTNRGRDEAVFRSDAYDECSHPISRADADGIVAEHNAMPVLLEIAAAGKDYEAAVCEFESTVTDDYTEAAYDEECAGDTHAERCPVSIAHVALMQALAKVMR
jgi:hypothetical protein